MTSKFHSPSADTVDVIQDEREALLAIYGPSCILDEQLEKKMNHCNSYPDHHSHVRCNLSHLIRTNHYNEETEDGMTATNTETGEEEEEIDPFLDPKECILFLDIMYHGDYPVTKPHYHIWAMQRLDGDARGQRGNSMGITQGYGMERGDGRDVTSYDMGTQDWLVSWETEDQGKGDGYERIVPPFLRKARVFTRSSILPKPYLTAYAQVTRCTPIPSGSLSGHPTAPHWKRYLHDTLDGLYKEAGGMPCVYEWIDALVGFLTPLYRTCRRLEKQEIRERERDKARTKERRMMHVAQVPVPVPLTSPSQWVRSETPLTDRKSVFLAHAHPCTNRHDATQGLWEDLLARQPRLSDATHNITAYRFRTKPSQSQVVGRGDGGGLLEEGYDDDGESAAGMRLLRMMQAMGVEGAWVCVTRWYGGVHLGPVRFKHINDVAKEVLLAIPDVLPPDRSSGKKGRRK